MSVLKTFLLAGALIELGAIFATTLSGSGVPVTDPDGTVIYNAALPYGLIRLLAGLVFSLGLILVVVGGAELFIGNNLIVLVWASGKIRGLKMLRNWHIVYIDNLFGAVGIAGMMFFTKQYTFG